VSYTWRIEAEDGSPANVDEAPTFPAQGDAESWLGEVWRELADAGADRATLLEDERVVYGPMSLRAE
jgi:hypothetical protein